MTHRDNLIKALKRQNPEYVPFYFSLCPEQYNAFKQKTGQDDYMEYYDMPVRFIYLPSSTSPADYSKYYGVLPEGTMIDEWGVACVPGTSKHFTRMIHPMEYFSSPKEIEEFPMPDVLADYRWKGIDEKVKCIKEAGLIAVNDYAISIFEAAWSLRGLENLLSDMMTDHDMAITCLERMTDIKVKMAARFARAGIDMIIYGDDVGTQKGMMMSPDLWRKWLKPALQKAIMAAKDINPDLIAYYHSDGMINEIIPDLIDIGVDVLNPVQPECMNPVKVKQMYGDRLSFWGTVGTQTTMPFGAPNEVKQVVKQMIDTVGRGGGFVIAPTHVLEPEVPWENIEAFIMAVLEYGKYPEIRYTDSIAIRG